jgi:hypothetical protein
MGAEAKMDKDSKPQGVQASAPDTGRQPRWHAPMDAALQGMNQREHVAERFEDFARKLVETAKPAKSKKRTRSRKS